MPQTSPPRKPYSVFKPKQTLWEKMRSSLTHSPKPQVPQAPFHLAPTVDVGPRRRALPQRTTSIGPQVESMPYHRPTSPSPDVPPVVQTYHNPHQASFHARSGRAVQEGPSSVPMERQGPTSRQAVQSPRDLYLTPTAGLRTMTADQRAAYLRDADARNKAPATPVVEKRSSGLRPLQLSSGLPATPRLAASPTMPTTPPPMDNLPSPQDPMLAYFNQSPPESPILYADEVPVDQPEPAEEPPAPEAAAAAPEAQPAPADPEPAQQVVISPRASQAPGAQVFSLTPGNTAPVQIVSGGSQQTGTITVEGSGAVFELFSHGQIVARVSVPFQGSGS